MCFIQTSCLFTLFVIIFLTLYLTSPANINRKKILRPYWLLDISSRIKEQRVHYRKKKRSKTNELPVESINITEFNNV